MSTALFAAGIFAHEPGQRLLHILLRLGDRGFRGLHDKCVDNTSGQYYQTGLKRVCNWPDKVFQEDIEFISVECPDIVETFEASFTQYVVDRFQNRKRPSHRCPPLLNFVRAYLESLGQHEALITGDYFSKRDQMLMRIACMDAARQALYALVTSENVRIELASEVGTLARSERSSHTSKHLADMTANEICPDDSISCVGTQVVMESVIQDAPPVQPPTPQPPTPQPPTPQPPTPQPPTPQPPTPQSPTPQSPTPPIVPPIVLPSSTHLRTSGTFPPPPKDTESVVSRHDFEYQEAVPPPPHPPRSVTSRQVASSRDSSVSIGVKTVRSPR